MSSSIVWAAACSGLCLFGLVGCGKATTTPVIIPDPTTIVAPTLVSIQPIAANQAEIIVKAGFEFTDSAWKLTVSNTNGQTFTLNKGAVTRLNLFNLVAYQLAGINSGQTYRFQFATHNAGGDSIYAERLYTHNVTGPHWIRLTHAPSVGGNFAAVGLSTDNLPSTGNPSLSVWRYVDEQTWQSLTYYPQNDEWLQAKDPGMPSVRHGVVRYRLQASQGVFYDFNGLGYLTTESLPGQRIYLKDMNGIVPFYAGPDGIVRWFVTPTQAYQLTEGGPTQLWIRKGTWEQYQGPDLPEPTGTLATFRVGTTGYVINQVSGTAPHVWAFDTQQEQWSRKANFPGPLRSQGIGFVASGNGYFGLGIDENLQTLRDIWQYDPVADRWDYVTDYPGEASTALTVGLLPNRTLLGLGYEYQPIADDGIRVIGCTDFWEFKTN